MIGNSIFLSGLVDLVQKQPGIELAKFKAGEPFRIPLEEFLPMIIIYDHLSADEKDVTRYITSHPDTAAIGLNASENKAVVLSGAQHPLFTINDFTQLIASMIGANEGETQAN